MTTARTVFLDHFPVATRPKLRKLRKVHDEIANVESLRALRNRVMFELTEMGVSQADIAAYLDAPKISVFKMVDSYRKSIESKP